MTEFSYQMDTTIVFGQGKVQMIGDLLREHGVGKRLLLVTDPGVLAAGLIDPILEQLGQTGYRVTVWSEVAQNPRDNDCQRAAALCVDSHAEAVLAVGGGSAMDTAKTIALLAVAGGKPADFADGRREYQKSLPVICVPTTAGTGSEVTRSAVITDSATHRKMTLKHASLRPRLAILDPLLTITVPRAITAATGVDALVHAIEGSTCRKTTPLAEAFGQRAMRLITPALPQAVAHGEDIAARSDMLLGSLLAGLCFGSTDVAAVHCLAEALGGLYDTPHGVANAVFLPVVLRFNAVADLMIHARLSQVMGFARSDDSDATATTRMIEGVSDLTRELGIPHLRALPGVRPEDFPELARLAQANGSTSSNIRSISEMDYRELLEQAYSLT